MNNIKLILSFIFTSLFVSGYGQHRGGHIQNKDFSNQYFTSGDFYGARANGAKFNNCFLSGANFHGADLKNTQFKEANVSRSTFYGADLKAARMEGTIADGSNFEGADMHKGQFSKSTFRCARFYGTSLNTSICRDCDFSGANLDRADLRAADLSGSNFSGANITKNTLIDSHTKGLPEKYAWGKQTANVPACKDPLSKCTVIKNKYKNTYLMFNDDRTASVIKGVSPFSTQHGVKDGYKFILTQIPNSIGHYTIQDEDLLLYLMSIGDGRVSFERNVSRSETAQWFLIYVGVHPEMGHTYKIKNKGNGNILHTENGILEAERNIPAGWHSSLWSFGGCDPGPQ